MCVFTQNVCEESIKETVDFRNRCKFLINFFIVLASYSFCAQYKVTLRQIRGSFVLLCLRKRDLSIKNSTPCAMIDKEWQRIERCFIEFLSESNFGIDGKFSSIDGKVSGIKT